MIVAEISKIEITNCATTKIRLGKAAAFPGKKVPFKTFTGLNDERYNAG